MIFTFQSPGISPALWGQADGNNPAPFARPKQQKIQPGKCSNVITPALSRHCEDNQKIIALHLSPAIPRLSPQVGYFIPQALTSALTSSRKDFKQLVYFQILQNADNFSLLSDNSAVIFFFKDLMVLQPQ